MVINRDWERVEAGDWKDLFHVARPRLRTRPVCLFVNHFISRVGNGMECSVLYKVPYKLHTCRIVCTLKQSFDQKMAKECPPQLLCGKMPSVSYIIVPLAPQVH